MFRHWQIYSRHHAARRLVIPMKGTSNGQECLYMLAMAEYNTKNYETAAEYFKKYYSSYPRGSYAELAKFYVGQSLYMSTPEPRLDQSRTVAAITALQEYLDVYPLATRKEVAQKSLFALQGQARAEGTSFGPALL